VGEEEDTKSLYDTVISATELYSTKY